MSYSPRSVAEWFVRKADNEDIVIDQIKLMKLVYIAKGVSLAMTGDSLFNESVEAWKYGPVIASLYSNFCHLGMNRINVDDLKICGYETAPENFSPESDRVLRTTWENFKKFSGIQLSNWTHEQGSPWDKEWNHNDGKGKMNHPIPDAIIKDYFERLISDDSGKGNQQPSV